MTTEKKAAGRLHHWVLDPDGATRCQNCRRAPGLAPAHCDATEDPASETRAEIERLRTENEELRRRLADAELPPLHKRGK